MQYPEPRKWIAGKLQGVPCRFGRLSNGTYRINVPDTLYELCFETRFDCTDTRNLWLKANEPTKAPMLVACTLAPLNGPSADQDYKQWDITIFATEAHRYN